MKMDTNIQGDHLNTIYAKLISAALLAAGFLCGETMRPPTFCASTQSVAIEFIAAAQRKDSGAVRAMLV